MLHSQRPTQKHTHMHKGNIAVDRGDGSSPKASDSSLAPAEPSEPYDVDFPSPSEYQGPQTGPTRRVWLYNLGIVLLSSLFLLTLTKFATERGGRPKPSDSVGWRYAIPSNMNINYCVEGDRWTPLRDITLAPQAVFDASTSDDMEWYYDADVPQQGVETSFDLPLSSDTLFFTSRGQNWNGAVRLQSSSNQPKNFAQVHIVLRYNKEHAIKHTKTCLMEKRIDENGVGLFAPFFDGGKPPHPREEMVSTFQITITLPEANQSSPIRIRNFETDSPDTKHEIDDLSQHVLFDSFSLKGSKGGVHVKSLTAIEGSIRTNNGPITGTFNVTNKLSLATSMAAIDVSVNLESRDKSIPQFKAHTHDGPLSAKIQLTSDSATGEGGIFDVSASTANGALDIRFPESPMNSMLNLAANTTNDRAIVYLHPVYEGTFDIRTSTNFPLILHKDPEVKDPSGKNRQRKIVFDSRENVVARTMVGSVIWDVWGKQRDDYGRVNIVTTNAPLHLNL